MVWWSGVAISFALYLAISQMVEDRTETEFEYQANNAQLAIQARVQSYIDVLQGVNALFYTNDQITREQFHAYVNGLNTSQSFPGITNLNFAPRIFARDKNAFESSVRSDTSLDARGYPDFSIKPSGERSEYHVLTYQEPMQSNLGTLGFDIGSIEKVAQTLAISRDTGQLSASGKLIQITGPHRHVGLAIRIPLYRRNMPIDTVADRRAAYYGSVGAGFDISKLMLGAVDQNILRFMRLKLYDAGQNDEQREPGTVDPEKLLFDSGETSGNRSKIPLSILSKDVFVKRAPMTVGLRVWEAEFSASKAAMRNGFDAYLPWLVLIVGMLASLLLYSVYYSLMSARRRAVELANDMTKDLRASEASLAEAQHMANLGSWMLEPDSGKMTWTAETYRIFGLDRFGETRYEDFLRRVHEEDRQRVRNGLERSIRTGEEFNTEHRIAQRDNSTRWVQTISRPGQGEHQSLLRGTIMDVTERKHIVETMQRSQELLRELTAYQDRVREDERKRIAREIHDELGQTLLALRIDVSMLDARTGKSHPILNEKVRGVLSHIDATVKTIRTIINNLRPAVLDLGLAAAIEWQVTEFRRRSGIACDLVMSEKEFALDDARATSLFRIVQESLSNVIRHANASRVVIELYQDGDRLAMKITDNGIGIYPERRKKSNSFGLVGVEERVLALNGEFLIDSAPGKGTVLTIFIPLKTVDAEQHSHTA